jgi:NADH dehydrogenase/NADH:ubiquinone oxidoreductase subunit G
VLSLAAKAAEVLGAAKDGWNGFGVLHTAAARVGALDLGFVPGEGGLDVAGMTAAGALDVLFLLGADEIEVPAGAFVVYQGSHGDKGAHRADVILPGAAYTEKSGTYVNTEGRVQMAARATFPPGDAKEDWAILRALSDFARQGAALRLAVSAAPRALRRPSAFRRASMRSPATAPGWRSWPGRAARPTRLASCRPSPTSTPRTRSPAPRR